MAKHLIALGALLLALIAAQLEAKTITDASGRSLEVPERVNRLIALGSSMAFVSYLNARDIVVGVEAIDKRDDIVKPYIVVNRDEFKELPVVGTGGSMRIHNHEEIIKLKPEVVFLMTTTPGEADALQKKIRIPVVVLSSGSPAFDQKTFLHSIRLAGDILDRRDRAQELTGYLLSLPEQLPFRAEKGSVAGAYVGGLSSRGNRDLTSTTTDSWPMRLAGIRNFMDGLGHRGQIFINKEHLLTMNPPLIFIDGNGLPLIRESVRKDPGFHARLKAFKNKDVWLVLPHTSYLSNPEILYINAFLMAKAAYPEHYGHIDPRTKADEVFNMFFGRPLYQYYYEKFGGFGRLELKGSEVELVSH